MTRSKVIQRIPHQNETAIRPALSDKQGEDPAFIQAYAIVLGRPPVEADLQRPFRVTPPFVHQMVLAFERWSFISRTPGAARSICLVVESDTLPAPAMAQDPTVRSPVQRH
ncbi:MarR family transcriptional regulator [Lichenibacterium dinghuense]|uniref:MarR family transcriptional regulator n=1 Tax=Lichenibacterium dinghuense TaxID=2895977 RepID=UPI001F3BC2AE|nr:MarR family transcriptional regulator [Lichenibacterium sp. 6Y81]